MKDIANELGVSLMTISKALRGHRDISEETRERVVRRARELGYKPNWVARSLVTGRTHLIGLVIPDLMHSFFAEVAKGVGRKLEPLGYYTVILNSEESPEAEEGQVQMLMARSVEGLIVASAETDTRHGQLKSVLEANTPLVLIDRMLSGIDANFVGVKDEEIGLLATTHLIEQGCRRIAHIRGPAITTGNGRLKGYRTALAKAGLESASDYIVAGDGGDHSGYRSMRRLLALNPKPDAVFCYNDPVAVGAIKAIIESGLKIPTDIAVIGAGNIHYSDLLSVPLSTIDQSSSAIGEMAAELLVKCIEAKTPSAAERVFITPKLIARASTRVNR